MVNLDYLMGQLEGERKRAVHFKPNGPFHFTTVHGPKFIDHPLSLKTAHFKLTHFVETLKGFSNSKDPVTVPIRVNPNIYPYVHFYISTGLKTSKFGIVENEV